jgi:hypothetical protein
MCSTDIDLQHDGNAEVIIGLLYQNAKTIKMENMKECGFIIVYKGRK